VKKVTATARTPAAVTSLLNPTVALELPLPPEFEPELEPGLDELLEALVANVARVMFPHAIRLFVGAS
jgi:hypothetical protein